MHNTLSDLANATGANMSDAQQFLHGARNATDVANMANQLLGGLEQQIGDGGLISGFLGSFRSGVSNLGNERLGQRDSGYNYGNSGYMYGNTGYSYGNTGYSYGNSGYNYGNS